MEITEEGTMTSTSEITTTARRIARELNRYAGGQLSGRCIPFYADGRPGSVTYGPGDRVEGLMFAVPWRRVTAREIQEQLDAHD